MSGFPQPPSRIPQVCLILHAIALAAATLAAAPSRLNKDAQALAKHLAPSNPAKSYKREDIGGISKKMVAIVEILEKSYRSNGPTPESLIDKAFSFRNDLGPAEEVALSGALLDAWRAANGMGLFNERGQFDPVVTKGRGMGERTLFELIVPGEVYAPASNQLMNVRLIREEERRSQGTTELTAREKAVGGRIKQAIEERKERQEIAAFRKGPKTNALGQTEEEHRYLWDNEMAKAGDLAKEAPKIRVAADLEATPSHMTKDRWRIGCEISNISSHPTEIKAEVWLIGMTWKKRDHFIMTKQEFPFRLRSGEVREFKVFTKSANSYKGKSDDHDELDKKERKKSYVRYRGFMVKITHETGVTAFIASDRSLASQIDPENESSTLGSLATF
ncbi:MAG: hypothetical protein AAGC68_14270 [Verrucomicrobiota bacterium]